mmetsp:Transcript_19348/g.27206  ORF Transcript_19348/g.27206 Transcript_19348/m.27206 type:complete len:105 (+) Transcript_19348:480-794(+)
MSVNRSIHLRSRTVPAQTGAAPPVEQTTDQQENAQPPDPSSNTTLFHNPPSVINVNQVSASTRNAQKSNFVKNCSSVSFPLLLKKVKKVDPSNSINWMNVMIKI